MKAIIHAGMPKTGSSSIQQTLMKKCPEDWVYPGRNKGNMGRQLMLMFEDEPWTATAFVNQGASREDVLRQKKIASEQLGRTLKAAAKAGKNTIFSAERLFNVNRRTVGRLHAYYADLGYEQSLLCYIRQPVSFMTSAFQQNLKGGLPNLFNFDNLYKPYRGRIEKFDTVFGRENVILKAFEKDALTGGDVVVDFYAELGHELPPGEANRVNETLSLPAVALLYAQRVLGNGFQRGFAGAGRSNEMLVSALATIPGPKPQLSRELVAPIFKENAEDIRWLETRVGIDVLDNPDDEGPEAIRGHEHLLQDAHANRDAIDALLDAELARDGDGPRDHLVREFRALRKILK
ncbi:MAG: hypothetical protein ACE369_17600 [Roseovarius sp.]